MEDFREEFRQDLLDDAKEAEMHEHYMRTDFDFFCDQNLDIIEQLNDSIAALQDECQAYGYEFNLLDFIN